MNRDTVPSKKEKQSFLFLDTEQIAFISFIVVLALLIVMAILPRSSKKTLSVDKEKITTPPPTLKEPEPSKKEELLENLPFPEEESQWGPLVKKHLWRVAYGNNPKIIQESKHYLKTVPAEVVSGYIHSLLKSEANSDRVLGAVGVRHIKIPDLVSEVADLLPQVSEEKTVEGVSFYLEALGLGSKNEIDLLSTYAFQSKLIRNRLAAFEALSEIKVPTLVPKLCEWLKTQPKSTPESVAIIQTIITSVQPDQYPLISNLFESSLSYPKESALLIMKTVDLDGFVHFYEKALTAESIPIRKRAYACLMELQSTHSVPLLLERAKNKELPRWEQILALETVGRCGMNLKPAEIDFFLTSKDPIFRFLVCSILVHLKDPRGISGLIELLSVSEKEIEVPQGSDMEEERTWLKDQTLLVLEEVTQKEFPDAVSWNNWWLKQQQSFKFLSVPYMKKKPALYENR